MVPLVSHWALFGDGLLKLMYCTSGVGHSFWSFLAGRTISGFANAGMTAMTSIIIVGTLGHSPWLLDPAYADELLRADLVPIREVAVWRAYTYTAIQLGRGVGMSLGGLIADKLSWRW